MAQTLTGFARQARQFPDQLERANDAGTKSATFGMAAAARANTRKAAPSGRLSGVGKRGKPVGIRYDVRGAHGEVKATGPYQLIERDTKGHRIPRARKRRRPRPLQIPGVGFRAYAQHPGTKGKHPFEKAVDEYGPKAPKEYQREVRKAMERTFRG